MDEQRDQAKRSLHSLKGMAATIGADALAEVAGEEEQRCGAGMEINIEQLRDFAARTEQALLEVGVTAPSEIATVDHVDGEASKPLTNAERGVLERLLLLLQTSDLSALDAVEELLALGAGDKTRWVALDREVQKLAFDRASDLVRKSLNRK